ncbi:hypothetical protein CES87_25275 [Pseudomonas sp. ERMR1:02]|nr:hypothetical protein CES87_25275 [Pseudomonas sp. ERMR1:02]
MKLKAADRKLAKGDRSVVLIQGSQHPFPFIGASGRLVLGGCRAFAADKIGNLLIGCGQSRRINIRDFYRVVVCCISRREELRHTRFLVRAVLKNVGPNFMQA